MEEVSNVLKDLNKSLTNVTKATKKATKALDSYALQLGSETVRESIEKVFLNEKTKEVGIRWKDGTVTTGKCSSEDQFDECVGFSIAVAAKVFGSKKKMHEFVWENFYPEA